MRNFYRVQTKSIKSLMSHILLLLFCFSGTAIATMSGSMDMSGATDISGSTELSEIELGYPRFIAKKTHVDYYHAYEDTYFFDAYNTNSKVFWQENEDAPKERVRANPFFYTQVDIDASNPDDPKVLDGSFLEVWGIIPGQRTRNNLLFTAEISELFWDTSANIIQFILEGSSQYGAVCDLGFCSHVDEVLEFELKRFKGNWDEDFSSRASAIATVPLPSAVWLFGCALFGLFGYQRRKAID